VHLTRRAHAMGVDGFLVVTPYYNLPTPRGIVAHFRAIAEASDKPIVVYNIPQRVVRNIAPDTMVELAEIPTVRAVKQATADLDQARRILAETDLELYAGNDDLVLPFLELGGVGGVCVYTHLVGARVKDIIRRFREEDADGARAIEAELSPIVKALAVTTNPQGVKAALQLIGWDTGSLRLPLVEATDEERETIRTALDRAGLLAPTPA
jgi:4-hydroxy-tetrahydrodipicolinate synthase